MLSSVEQWKRLFGTTKTYLAPDIEFFSFLLNKDFWFTCASDSQINFINSNYSNYLKKILSLKNLNKNVFSSLVDKSQQFSDILYVF